nr:HIRAN domain-containing protein [uncultured Desulfobacter sp.]
MNTSKLILAWRNHNNHDWVPVGKLSYCNSQYIFEYTEGAKKLYKEGQFAPFSFMENLNEVYRSESIFPIFMNRLMQKSRPEYDNYLKWLNLTEETASPIEELARSGGIRATDDLQLFPFPTSHGGQYKVSFFSHGIRYLPSSYVDRLNDLDVGERLFIMFDVQNKFDANALLLRTSDPVEIVGYVPRFFSHDFNRLIKINGAQNTIVEVQKINQNSPSQFRLLCRFRTKWPKNFEPFESPLFE